MTSSASLNPASMPFFPGGGARITEDERERSNGLGFRLPSHLDQDRRSISSLSISPSDFRSVRSSPSPPQDDLDRVAPQFHPSTAPGGDSRHSPALGQVRADRPYPALENPLRRETSMSGSFDSLPGGEDTPGPISDRGMIPTNGGSQSFKDTFFNGMFSQSRERLATAPATAHIPNSRSSSFNANMPFVSASPVSSLGSGSQIMSNMEHQLGFEAQLKSSPLICEMLDKLGRCENTARELQRELVDVHRKVNVLLERTLDNNSRPEFKDPFGSQDLRVVPGLAPRGSINGIAPNQPTPSEDITQINQRLNTLTTSVGQLLAIQTQNIQASQLSNNHLVGTATPQLDMAPNQMLSPGMPSSASNLNQGLPGRQEPRPLTRTPNPPMRTWSTGNLEVTLRPNDLSPSLNRQDLALRDKRRSTIGLVRRDSGSMDSISGSRDSTASISKWDQLPLSGELLRSLSKFGVGPPNKIQQRALPFLLRGADIIAQAPPTQERIAAYVIPAIQTALTHLTTNPINRGPSVLMISTTVDQATQAQRMVRDLGGAIGVKSALGVGSSSSTGDLSQELRLLQQNIPHVICGTPQKLHALFTTPGGLVGSEIRLLVIDEVDQLIARNLHDFVFNIVKLLPPPRSRSLNLNNNNTPTGTPGLSAQSSFSFDANNLSPFPNQNQNRRFSGILSPALGDATNGSPSPVERQTALFSNTVPQDVLNLASAINLREPVRVLVRRDGNVTQADTNQGSRGLRQFYLYLAFTAGGRADPLPSTPGGLGIIGSGRGASSAETAQAREWKLDALADLFDDIDVPQAIVHVGGMNALDSVVYKLASRGLDAVPLHGDMNAGTKLAALNKFRSSSTNIMRQSAIKVLVVYDVQVKSPEVNQVPLVVNYDLPKAVEEYLSRVSPAMAPNHGRAGVVINFVTATGGDVEMLRSIECYYKIKCPEVPMSLRDIV